MMFHGSIRALLDKEPSGGLIRKHLYAFIMDYLNGKAVYSKMYRLPVSPSFPNPVVLKIFYLKSLIASISHAINKGFVLLG